MTFRGCAILVLLLVFIANPTTAGVRRREKRWLSGFFKHAVEQTGSAFKDFGDKVADGTQTAVAEVGEAAVTAYNGVKKAGEITVREVGKAGEIVATEVVDAGETAVREVGKAGKAAVRKVGKWGETSVREVEKAGKTAVREVGKAADTAATEMAEEVKAAVREVKKASETTGKEVGKAGNIAVKEVVKIAIDAANEIEGVVEDTVDVAKDVYLETVKTLKEQYQTAKETFHKIFADGNFDIVVAKLISFIDSKATMAVCEIACDKLATIILPGPGNLACAPVCKGALLLIQELTYEITGIERTPLKHSICESDESSEHLIQPWVDIPLVPMNETGLPPMSYPYEYDYEEMPASHYEFPSPYVVGTTEPLQSSKIQHKLDYQRIFRSGVFLAITHALNSEN